VYVSDEDFGRLAYLAMERKRSVSDLIQAAIKRYLKEEEKVDE